MENILKISSRRCRTLCESIFPSWHHAKLADQVTRKPPSTGSIAPLIMLARSESRNMIGCTTWVQRERGGGGRITPISALGSVTIKGGIAMIGCTPRLQQYDQIGERPDWWEAARGSSMTGSSERQADPGFSTNLRHLGEPSPADVDRSQNRISSAPVSI